MRTYDFPLANTQTHTLTHTLAHTLAHTPPKSSYHCAADSFSHTHSHTHTQKDRSVLIVCLTGGLCLHLQGIPQQQNQIHPREGLRGKPTASDHVSPMMNLASDMLSNKHMLGGIWYPITIQHTCPASNKSS